jgi:hypothetical protein
MMKSMQRDIVERLREQKLQKYNGAKSCIKRLGAQKLLQ